jgi:hypothetical protein
LVQAHYEAILKLEIDKSGKDLTRLCFYSWDENLYLNENASNLCHIERSRDEIQKLKAMSPSLEVTKQNLNRRLAMLFTTIA